MHTSNSYPDRGIARRKQLKDEYGLSLSTQHRLEKSDPTFPKPRKLSEGTVGFLRAELDEWANKRPVSELHSPMLNHDHRQLVEAVANTIWEAEQTNLTLVGDLKLIRTLSELTVMVPVVAAAGYIPEADKLERLIADIQSQHEKLA